MTVQTKPKKHRGGWLKNPKMARNNETIGGGYWVFRRGDDTGRIRPSMWPFEYDSQGAAAEQAAKLAKEHPTEQFIVVGELGQFYGEAFASRDDAA
ncbi:hypothetical protein [Oricola sp.]|uniref:hypothetical protein n=1 Tax=Oricola sp. TaxID=1979950 RepID=UPI0025EBC6D1|nr:hypothetical protein [Oricola sp.]MCI5073425.1 hypothetical protein [Oricola sp.]